MASAAAAPYTRLEALYNARNFWACLQVAQQHVKAGETHSVMSRLAYDLADASKWEALFLPLEPHEESMPLAVQEQAGPAAAVKPAESPELPVENGRVSAFSRQGSLMGSPSSSLASAAGSRVCMETLSRFLRDAAPHALNERY
ncbi:MAG: hypothetical protein MMC33_010770 [Icmadophila ericetorum]|nr:hypothetical protein [Icmadophila ericetorum]